MAPAIDIPDHWIARTGLGAQSPGFAQEETVMEGNACVAGEDVV